MMQKIDQKKRVKIFSPLMKRIYILLVSVLLLVALFSKIAFFYGKSASIEGSLFLLLKGVSPKMGDLAIIEGHETAYHKDLIFLKRVVGKEGDRLSIKGDLLFLGDLCVGPLRTQSLNSKPLTPITKAFFEGKNRAFEIPPSKIFLKGDAPLSFDSRYKEFGLVDIKHVRGKALKVF